MRRRLLTIFFVLAISFGATATLGIDLFDLQLTLNEDGTLHVVERLTVTFYTPHHGIEREIPVSYRVPSTGENVTIDFRLDGITLNKGAVPVLAQRRGRDQYLRIGDPNRTITGTHVYAIEYTVGRSLGFSDEYVRLYWNVTGNDWRIPIDRTSATVKLPGSVDPATVLTVSYIGYSGSGTRGGGARINEDAALVFDAGWISPGEGLTIDLAIPRNQLAIVPPSIGERIVWFLDANKFAGLPILALIATALLWYRTGRDPRKGTIAPAFEPPRGLLAGEIGVLIDDRIDLRDISAMVIELAVLGHLSIEEIGEDAAERDEGEKVRFRRREPNDYRFIRRSTSTEGLSDVQRSVLEAIFDEAHPEERTLSSLENSFYKSLPAIKSALYSSLIEAGYYPHNPERTRRSFAGIGMMGILGGIALGVGSVSLYLGIAVALSGFIVLAFSPIMPRKTRKGVRALEGVLGLSEYIRRAEVDRIEFHNAPERGPRLFEKLLPYAIALGLSKVWTRQFEGLLAEPPQWYKGVTPTFHGHLFALSLIRLSSGMERSFASAPRTATAGRSAWGGRGSFGGGFSGGGFGGGGGGGW